MEVEEVYEHHIKAPGPAWLESNNNNNNNTITSGMKSAQQSGVQNFKLGCYEK